MEQVKCFTFISWAHHLWSYIDFWWEQPFSVGTSIFAYGWIVQIGESTATHISRVIIASRMLSCETPVDVSASWTYPSSVTSSLTFLLNIIVVSLQKWVIRSWAIRIHWRFWFISKQLATIIGHQRSFLLISFFLDFLIALLVKKVVSLLFCPFLILNKSLLRSSIMVLGNKNPRTKSKISKVFFLLNPLISESIRFLF